MIGRYWMRDGEVSCDGHVAVSERGNPFRPVCVIDPEDREQVERLVDYYYAGDGPTATDIMQTALRSLIAPPKPTEPTGLGAVVEDTEGRKWIRFANVTRVHWLSEDGDTVSKWSGIDAVRVLSEGVQP